VRFTGAQKPRIAQRLIEVVREMGVLLLAFAPLEFTLQGGTASAFALWGFVSTGVALLAISLYAEARD
jgi:hypothetical protein